MREIPVDTLFYIPETRRTEFTKEEMLDIIDFYLQYKPMLDENKSNPEKHPQFDPHDFTMLLSVYKWWMLIILRI